MAVVLVAMVNFRVAVVPILDEQRESMHMTEVGAAMAAIKSEADRQVDGRSRAPVSTSVPMKPQEPGGFTTDGTMASYLSFDPGVRGVKMDAHELFVQLDKKVAVFGPDETWTNITSGDEIVNVTSVQHLRVRIEDPANEADEDHLSVTVKNATGAYAGDIKIYIKEHPSGYSVNVRVRDADNDVLYDQGESLFNQDTPPFYWVDALSDEVQFGDVIQAAEGPVKLQFNEGGMSGAFTIVYYEDSVIGELLLGSIGKLYQNWSREDVGGLFLYESQNVRFIRQDLYFETGGIIVDQPTGNTFFVDPALDIEKSGNRTIFRLTAPILVGEPAYQSGFESIPVRVQSLDDFHVEGTATNIGFNVTTAHPGVWTTFWRDRFVAADYTEAAGHFKLDNGTDWARFDFYGKETDPTSTVHDMTVELHLGQVEVIMRR